MRELTNEQAVKLRRLRRAVYQTSHALRELCIGMACACACDPPVHACPVCRLHKKTEQARMIVDDLLGELDAALFRGPVPTSQVTN